MKRHLTECLWLAAAIVLLVAAAPAEARIVCHDGYQQNSGGEVQTPYCQEEYLAQVAREHGMKVSGAQLRASYGLEREACQLSLNDIRVAEFCNPFRPDHGHHCKFFQC